MSAAILSFTEHQESQLRLIYGNHGQSACRYLPGNFAVSVEIDSIRAEHRVDAVQLEIPPGWVSDRPVWRRVSPTAHTIEWQVFPCGTPRGFQENVRLVALSEDHDVLRLERTVEIELILASQFRSKDHVISRPNSVEGWGVVEPSREALSQTFTWVPFRDQFFRGLYRAIVFLNGDGSNPGGLCSGMARAALERSLNDNPGEPTLDEVILWHGRQLSDRALVSGAKWLFFGSPKRAFNAFRDDLLGGGMSDRCFDIGVPRPWRRDIFSALQGQGHTVVPYAVEQTSSDKARVFVYDPNDPGRSTRGEAKITFLLDQNQYIYEPFGGTPLERTTVIAVRQAAYRDGHTAVMAATTSAMMSLFRGLRQTWVRSIAPLQTAKRKSPQGRHSWRPGIARATAAPGNENLRSVS
ncbi:MAG: hypothetical protein WBW04_16710 [Nitrolancea sp.]